MIDLRSDTVTKPTPGMIRAMTEAPLGDDVLDGDPTVRRLEERMCELSGKAAACFVASGVMANLTAMMSHTNRGDRILTHEHGHVHLYEAGGYASVAGCTLGLLPGERGLVTADAVRAEATPGSALYPPTTLLVVENTHNRGGGSVWPMERFGAACAAARDAGLRVHLDGARLWHACVASGVAFDRWVSAVDSAACAFSKGLGAPAGSAVVGDADFIERVRRTRRVLGGAMRQAGVLAAAALYGIEHNREGLEADHRRAAQLAAAIADTPGLDIEPESVETNIVIFRVDRTRFGDEGATRLCARLEDAGVLMIPFGPGAVRAVTHLDVSEDDIERAIRAIRATIKSM